ncbi:hypothetical protein V9T40_004064 [Parthenolecanium corni]|uniref:Coiled-coil domain-containing protein 12 n=1 Tax=Parthenolecanium corni TaxID=536013 RepID=A0AAN9Y2T8_9HEMI
MASVVQEKLGYAEIEARKRRERLLRLKRKAKGELDHDEEEKQEEEDVNDDAAITATEDPSEETNTKKEQLDELDLSNLAPRKIDWDLKRGIAKSLEILQDRTNEVITEIVRERLDETETD